MLYSRMLEKWIINSLFNFYLNYNVVYIGGKMNQKLTDDKIRWIT